MILKTRGGGWDTYTQLARVKFMGLLAKDVNNNRAAAAAEGGSVSLARHRMTRKRKNRRNRTRKN